MSVRVSTWAWKQPIGGNRKLVLLALADQANDAGCCWPAQSTLAAKCGISEETLRAHIVWLESEGFLGRDRRHRGDGARTSDLYTLALPGESEGGTGDHPEISGRLPEDFGSTKSENLRLLKEEPSGEPSGEPTSSVATSSVASLCQLLADLIVARDAKAKVEPDGDRWRTDMRLLIERDQRSATDVERVIRWSQDDGFWAPNILSPVKLRKQFATLWGQMNRGAASQSPAIPLRERSAAKRERDFSRFDKAMRR